MPSPRISILDAADRDFIHERSLEVLWQTGVTFFSATARGLLEAAGCKVDHSNARVWIPPELVDWAVGQPRTNVRLAGREREHDVLLDGSATYSTTGGICPYVVDADTDLFRIPRLNDLEDVTRIADALKAVGIVWYALSPTASVEPKMADLAATACMLANTGKHVMGQVLHPAAVPYVLELLRLAAQNVSLKDNSPFSIIYCPISPLQHDADALDCALALATEGIPIDIYSLALAGATSPITVAGTVIQTNCEVLSAVVALQLAAPGCSLIYSASAGIADMRTGGFAASTPETVLMNVALTEVAHGYRLPALSVGYLSDARTLEFRCGLEDMGLLIPTRLAGADIMAGLGTVGSGQAISLPKLVLDAELAGYADRVVRGFELDVGHAQLEVIADVGPGGHFLGRKETRSMLRSGEHWKPQLLSRDSGAAQLNATQPEIDRAKSAVEQLLSEHKPSPLETGVAERIEELLRQAQRELPDA